MDHISKRLKKGKTTGPLYISVGPIVHIRMYFVTVYLIFTSNQALLAQRKLV